MRTFSGDPLSARNITVITRVRKRWAIYRRVAYTSIRCGRPRSLQAECRSANNALQPKRTTGGRSCCPVAFEFPCGLGFRLDRPNDMNPIDAGPSRVPPDGLDRHCPPSAEKTAVTNHLPPDVRVYDGTNEFERGLGAVLSDWNARGDRSCSR